MDHVRLTMVAAATIMLAWVMMASAQAPVKQIKLSEKQVQNFIAAQKDMAAITQKMQGSTNDKPDPKIQAELDKAARKQGFKSFTEYDEVAANISMIMAGIDPKTKAFSEPKEAIKKEIQEIAADKAIPQKERQKMLQELNEALKVAQPVEHAGNVVLVKKYFDQIDAALP